MRKRIITNIIVAVLALCLCIPLVTTIASSTVFAAPEAIVDSTNPWESGGQITLNLSGCDGYKTITAEAAETPTGANAMVLGTDTTLADIQMNGWGAGAALGVHFKPTPKWDIAVTYNSQLEVYY